MDSWRQTLGRNLSCAQDVSSQVEGQSTKVVQGSCPAVLDWKVGIPQQRGETPGGEQNISMQLPTPPPPFSKLQVLFIQVLSVKGEEIALPMA